MRTPRATGWQTSWVPWTTSTGQVIAPSTSSVPVTVSLTYSALRREIITSPVVPPDQPTTSS